MTIGWPWPVLWQGQIGNIGLSIGNSENLIFQNFCSLWRETNWDNEDMWVLKFKVISWPWPKVIYIWKLKLAFLRNDLAIVNQILFCAWPKYQVSVSQDHWSSGIFLALTPEQKAHRWAFSVPMLRRPSVHIFKHLLLRNRLANQSQILCGASLGRGNESLFAASRSHDQDGRHTHIW